jgi:excisionase family DNA binding protein
MLSLLEAANRTGKTKPTILKAIKRGRLSAKKDEHEQWRIDPAELFRVYPPVNEQGSSEETRFPAVEAVELDAVKRERDLLQAQVDDLRRRLDASEQERRDTSRQLTALLTDQRKPEAVAISPQKPTEGRLSRAWSILRGKA